VINYSDQSNRRGEEMSSEKEGLKTSISIINSCNEFLRPADRRGGKKISGGKEAQKERHVR
jgi:hypothetical protein